LIGGVDGAAGGRSIAAISLPLTLIPRHSATGAVMAVPALFSSAKMVNWKLTIEDVDRRAMLSSRNVNTLVTVG
jgi:hypothetical protein